jgi:hypothetical protein
MPSSPSAWTLLGPPIVNVQRTATPELASLAAEWARIAGDCERHAAAWTQRTEWWAYSSDDRLRRAAGHAREAAEEARRLAARLRAAAQEVLAMVAPAP